MSDFYGTLFLTLVGVTIVLFMVIAYVGGLGEVFPPCPTDIGC